MKTSKASSPNSIPSKILKLFKKEFSKPLSDTTNLSFNQSIFPDLLKIANVISIHKKGDKLDCNNYDIVSTTPGGLTDFGKLPNKGEGVRKIKILGG